MAVGLNASFRIKAKALSTNEKLVPIIYMHAIKYNTAMNGTIFCYGSNSFNTSNNYYQLES